AHRDHAFAFRFGFAAAPDREARAGGRERGQRHQSRRLFFFGRRRFFATEVRHFGRGAGQFAGEARGLDRAVAGAPRLFDAQHLRVDDRFDGRFERRFDGLGRAHRDRAGAFQARVGRAVAAAPAFERSAGHRLGGEDDGGAFVELADGFGAGVAAGDALRFGLDRTSAQLFERQERTGVAEAGVDFLVFAHRDFAGELSPRAGAAPFAEFGARVGGGGEFDYLAFFEFSRAGTTAVDAFGRA